MAELINPAIDFSGLADLPKVYREARTDAARQKTLADLGSQDGNLNYGEAAKRLFQAGDWQGGLGLAQLAATAGKTDVTDEIKEYRLDMAQRKAAGQPEMNFGDWKTALKRAGAIRVNTVVNSGEKSYDTALGKEYADNFIGMQKAGRAAVGEMATLDTLDNLTKDPNFYSGAGAERFALPLKQIITKLGGDPNGAASMETFRALSNKSVLDTMGGSLGTGFSNADRDFVVGQVANLGNTPEGNRALIGVARKVASRKQEIAKLARDYAAKNGGRVDAGFDQELADFASKNPLFPQAGGAPQPVATKRRAGASAVKEGTTATNPQTNERIIFRGGKWVPMQ
jgi:hypothetical protein